MHAHQSGQVQYYTFDSFQGTPLTHAVFTRHGGVSQGVWASLNVGLTVGDNPKNVVKNRQLSFRALGRQIESLSDSWLIHGQDVLIYDRPRPADQESPPKADIILTDNPQVTLFMRYADCVPILLYDPVHHAIGLAHSGWMGTVKRVGAAAVRAMQIRYGSRPADMLAAIGPSIGPDWYQVGSEVVEEVKKTFNQDASELLPRYNTATHFDLWAANRLILKQAGVQQIESSNICTGKQVDTWFSHRAEKGKTGRFGVLMALHE